MTETEFKIDIPTTTWTAGTFTFNVANKAKFPHNLIIEGPGVDKTASPTLQGGAAGSVTVTLQKGTYEIWCGVDGHKDKGMDMKITVG